MSAWPMQRHGGDGLPGALRGLGDGAAHGSQRLHGRRWRHCRGCGRQRCAGRCCSARRRAGDCRGCGGAHIFSRDQAAFAGAGKLFSVDAQCVRQRPRSGRHACAQRGWRGWDRYRGRGSLCVADKPDCSAHRHQAAGFGVDGQQHAVGWRFDFEARFVGFDDDHRFAGAHRVADGFQPRLHAAFVHLVPEVGHAQRPVLELKAPPSTSMVWPVMKDASSLHRKATSAATSSAVP